MLFSTTGRFHAPDLSYFSMADCIFSLENIIFGGLYVSCLTGIFFENQNNGLITPIPKSENQKACDEVGFRQAYKLRGIDWVPLALFEKSSIQSK